jgi:hypothetical protein
MSQERIHQSPDIEIDESVPFETVTQTVPLENRIAHLGLNIEPIAAWLTPTAIAESIGSHTRWVKSTSERFGITPNEELAPDGRGLVTRYPPLTLELMQDEWQWWQNYLQLDKRLSSNRIAEFVGRSLGWTNKTLEELDVKPTRMKTSYKALVYPRQVVRTLREINLSTPLDDGWYTLRGLVEQSGQDREWIERQLTKANVPGETRRSALTGRLFIYYPPEACEIINSAIDERPPAGGEWRTAEAMASLIPRSESWIKLRIKKRYHEFAEMRQDDHAVGRLHYPPFVVDELLAEAKELESFPAADGYLTSSALARKVGKSTLWVMNRIPKLDIEPEQRRDLKDRIQYHYPPDTVERLISLPEDILRSSNNSSRGQIENS